MLGFVYIYRCEVVCCSFRLSAHHTSFRLPSIHLRHKPFQVLTAIAMPASSIQTGASAEKESAMARSTSRQSNLSDGLTTSEQGSAAAGPEGTQGDEDDHTVSGTVHQSDDGLDEMERQNLRALLLQNGFQGKLPANFIRPGEVIGNQVINNDGKIVSQETSYESPRTGRFHSKRHMPRTTDDASASPERCDGTTSSEKGRSSSTINKAMGKVKIGSQTFNY